MPDPSERSGGHKRRWLNRASLLAGLLLGSPLVAPQLLAFPHRAEIAGHTVYSEQPITPAVARVVADADRKMLADPLGRARPLTQPIFLTDGGWRWRWLAISSGTSFALSRPLGEPVIVNRSDPERDLMRGRGALGNRRRLSDILAHEFAHGAIRAEFGIPRALILPRELVEGYGDHVAGSSTLSDAQARELIRTGSDHPALLYWSGRKKVERALAANGGDVGKLFEEWR